MRIKIAIVEDQDLFREGLKLILSQIEGIDVCFDTSNGFELLDYIRKNPVDVVLMDINMPVIDGVETTKEAIKLRPELKIIALTLHTDLTHFTLMQNAGAKGFITKNVKKCELQQAIDIVQQGGYYFSPELMKIIAISSSGSNLSEKFTQREFDVLKLVCEGLSSKEISEKLFISIKTVEVHRSNIFSKADVKNVAELIVWAIQNNYFAVL